MSRPHATTKVLLVDDHALFRAGVAEIFAAESMVTVVGEARDGDEAVSLAKNLGPDVVLLDIEMPGLGVEETVRQISRNSPSSRVVILTMHDDPRLVRTLLAAGARAYVIKSATREELLATVRTVHEDPDRIVLSVSQRTFAHMHGGGEGLLSGRESEVLSLVAEGLTNAQVASRLYISEGTVKRHLTNVYSKLAVSSRMDAVNKAGSLGLVGPLARLRGS